MKPGIFKQNLLRLLLSIKLCKNKYHLVFRLKKKNAQFSSNFSPENFNSAANIRNFRGNLFKKKKNNKTPQTKPPNTKHTHVTARVFFVLFNNLL